ncbi:MAG: hypothetical protein AB7H90_03310 [Alphaproteobacteria bacterium]
MTSVWIVEGIHPYIPGTPRYVCSTEPKAWEKAAELVNVLCRDYGLPECADADHWEQALSDVQDRIIKENDLAETILNPLDPEELGEATGADIWITEETVL